MVAETDLDDVEKLALVLRVTVSELLCPPCDSWEDRVVKALLDRTDEN